MHKELLQKLKEITQRSNIQFTDEEIFEIQQSISDLAAVILKFENRRGKPPPDEWKVEIQK